jgi:hypothetical protein
MISTNVTKENLPQKSEYPCLKQSKNVKSIVLFTKAKKGTVVFLADYNNKFNIYPIGTYIDNWAMNNFIPFEGELFLKND